VQGGQVWRGGAEKFLYGENYKTGRLQGSKERKKIENKESKKKKSV
jgi:hypothetical protein